MTHNVKFYYTNVPKLGNVVLSRHCQAKMLIEEISEEKFEDVLFNGVWEEEGFDVLRIEKDFIRLIIVMNPKPFSGARVVKTLYRVKSQYKVI